jgi:hypothetical protein
LPRRFYIYLGVVLVCLIAVLASFRFIGAEGLLVLLPALVIAIPCLTAAAKVFRVAVFPSPEKQAAQAQAKANSSSASAVDAFFTSLEGSPPGQPKAAAPPVYPSTAPKPSTIWDQAVPISVRRGERLPMRLQASPYRDNLGKIIVLSYVLVLLLILGLGGGLAGVGEKSLPQLEPTVRLALRAMVVLGGLLLGGVALSVGRWQLRRLSELALELSEHPLEASKSYDVVLWSPHPTGLEQTRMELVCEEDAHAGTTDRSSRPLITTKVVLRQRVHLDSVDGLEGARSGRLDMPVAAGSFSLNLHRVRWHFRLQQGPWVARYPVVVCSVRGTTADLIAPATALPNRTEIGVVTLWIDGSSSLLPGATLTGGLRVRTHRDALPLRKLELSVLWTAEQARAPGSGSAALNRASGSQQPAEMGVCHFAEHEATEEDTVAGHIVRQFHAVLPDGPPTFHGKLFDIKWAVRLRLAYMDGDELTWDLPFVLRQPSADTGMPAVAGGEAS